MNTLVPLTDSTTPTKSLIRKSMQSNNVDVLSKIYSENINIAIWQRDIAKKLGNAVNTLITSKALKPLELAVTPDNTYEKLINAIKPNSIDQADISVLCEDITHLVDMFCCLFDLKRTGLRLATLDHPMCPRFHVDKIPCRLVTTYQGAATQWLNHCDVNREKLGAGSLGKADAESGLFKNTSNINQLTEGDVALLKGEYWGENEGFGLVHRSPPTVNDQPRLLLTLDFL